MLIRMKKALKSQYLCKGAFTKVVIFNKICVLCIVFYLISVCHHTKHVKFLFHYGICQEINELEPFKSICCKHQFPSSKLRAGNYILTMNVLKDLNISCCNWCLNFLLFLS